MRPFFFYQTIPTDPYNAKKFKEAIAKWIYDEKIKNQNSYDLLKPFNAYTTKKTYYIELHDAINDYENDHDKKKLDKKICEGLEKFGYCWNSVPTELYYLLDSWRFRLEEHRNIDQTSVELHPV